MAKAKKTTPKPAETPAGDAPVKPKARAKKSAPGEAKPAVKRALKPKLPAKTPDALPAETAASETAFKPAEKRPRKKPVLKAASPAPVVPPPPAVQKPAAPAPRPLPPPPARVEEATAVPEPVKPAPVAPKPKVTFTETTTVKELAEKLGVSAPEVIKKLLVNLKTRVTINQRLSAEIVELVADAFGFEAVLVPVFSDEADTFAEDPAALVPRSPVVTVMGHVDHGKTSLLDAIRSANVAAGEAGGITQHIGAYQVHTPKGVITFLDTPGHEAFTAMRARGAVATDLVVLVVAADDGVMPQTIEAIDHAKAAGVPIVVAINKVDLPTANVQRIKQSLSDYNLAPEDWGGKTIMVEVSAKTRLNIDKLLEMILLEAEILELKANPNRPAKGMILEAKLDARRGPVATLLVKTGTLKVPDVFVCGFTFGKVKALVDDHGQRLESAGPSRPVEILGFSEPPQAGDHLVAVASEREAREIAERRRMLAREAAQKPRQHLTLEHLHAEMQKGKLKELPLILKTDVQGSLQAVRDSLERIQASNIRLRIIHAGVGNINASDILLAEASDAVVIGFHVKAEPAAEEQARRAAVEVRTYQIIYELLGEVKAALEGLLEPELKEVFVGRAQVKQVFRIPKGGAAAGCLVSEGKIVRGGKVRVLRDAKPVFEGALSTLKRFKDDVRDVERGFECGLTVEGFSDFRPGDLIEAFQIEKRAKKLDQA